MLSLQHEEVIRQAIRNNAWAKLRAELESAFRYKSTRQAAEMLAIWDAMVANIMELDDFPVVLRKPIDAANDDYDVDDYEDDWEEDCEEDCEED